MGDRLLEGGAAQSLVAGLAPPFDRQIVEPSLGEVMGDRLGFGRCAFAQDLGCTGMQRLAATLEQAVVGGILDQRVLEAVVRLRSIALDEQNVGLGEPLQRRLQRALIEAGHGLEQSVREAAAQNCANLRGLTRSAEPIEPRGERLLQCRRDRLRAALLAALQQEARNLLNEQRNAAGALADTFDDVPWQSVMGRKSSNHLRDLHAIERRQGDHAMVRPHAPRRAELWPRRRDDEQRRLRPALGQTAHEIERSRVGPVQVLEGEHNCLRPCGRQNPCRHRRQLPAAQLLWREFRCAVLWQEDIDQRREQRRVFGWVEADQFQSVLEVGQALFGGQVRAEALAAPFGDRMQRRVLQQLRRRPLDPGVRRLAEAAVKLLHQPRLAQARLADDQRELALAFVRALPAPSEKTEFLLAPHEGR